MEDGLSTRLQAPHVHTACSRGQAEPEGQEEAQGQPEPEGQPEPQGHSEPQGQAEPEVINNRQCFSNSFAEVKDIILITSYNKISVFYSFLSVF